MELSERLGQLVANDFLIADFQPLEERLVEQPPLVRAGLPVGDLDAVGQREGRLQGRQHLLVAEAEPLHPLGGTNPLAADPRLLLGEQALAHLIGIVGLEQLALLGFKPCQLGLGRGQFLGRQLGDHCHVSAYRLADGLPLLLAELHPRIAALDCLLDSRRPVVALRAAPLQAPAADEVLISPAVAGSLAIGQPPAALRAEEAAAQVVEVAPGALAALALAGQQVLNLLKRRLVHQRLMAPLVGLAAVVDDAEVVGIAQQRSQPVDPDPLHGRFPRRPGAQAAPLQNRRQLRQRVVAAGVEAEGFAHQRRPLGIERDGADLVAFNHGAAVEITERRPKRRAALLGLLRRALDDLGRQVAAVELGNRGHDAVQQQA